MNVSFAKKGYIREASCVMEEQEKVMNELQTRMKMKENFTAGMIHDIRNPLQSMICCLDYMKENEVI